MKKRLTFSFLPWAAAAGVCVGGFARGADEVPAAPTPADASVLSAADAAPAAEAAAVADEAVAGGAGTKTVKKWVVVPEIRDVEATEWTTEVRERSFQVSKKVPRIEEKTRNYTVMVPEQR
ncbi:MAG: hypothetical protein WCO76_14785, partial [Planctomycetota bacterium]